jgi:hypothetical protein
MPYWRIATTHPDGNADNPIDDPGIALGRAEALHA